MESNYIRSLNNAFFVLPITENWPDQVSNNCKTAFCEIRFSTNERLEQINDVVWGPGVILKKWLRDKNQEVWWEKAAARKGGSKGPTYSLFSLTSSVKEIRIISWYIFGVKVYFLGLRVIKNPRDSFSKAFEQV